MGSDDGLGSRGDPVTLPTSTPLELALRVSLEHLAGAANEGEPETCPDCGTTLTDGGAHGLICEPCAEQEMDALDAELAQQETTMWTFEGYWNAVLGANRSAEDVIREFDLDASDRRGLDEWLGHAEAEAWRVGGQGGTLPAEWTAHHDKALDALASP